MKSGDAKVGSWGHLLLEYECEIWTHQVEIAQTERKDKAICLDILSTNFKLLLDEIPFWKLYLNSRKYDWKELK